MVATRCHLQWFSCLVGEGLYSMIGNVLLVMVIWGPRQTERHTPMKILPSRNFVGGWYVVINSVIP